MCERIKRKIRASSVLVNSVKWRYFLHGSWVLSAGAPGEIRTPDPQIRSLLLNQESPLVRLAAGRNGPGKQARRFGECYPTDYPISLHDFIDANFAG
jgi:hypothetical protein